MTDALSIGPGAAVPGSAAEPSPPASTAAIEAPVTDPVLLEARKG